MTVCPVCQNNVQGDACEVCGKVLVAPAPVTAAPGTMPELEHNAIAGGNANVAVERLAELADHRQEAVAVTPEPVQDLERTGFPSAPAAVPDPIPELEQTHFAPDGKRTALPKALTCRYCGHVQQQGYVCDGCGMTLPRYTPRAAAPEPSDLHPCPSCGVKGLAGRRCMACGSLVRAVEA